jgi:hypothetical protein
LSDEKAAIKKQMEDFFKKVDKRVSESADEVMRKYQSGLKLDSPKDDSSPSFNKKNEEKIA